MKQLIIELLKRLLGTRAARREVLAKKAIEKALNKTAPMCKE